MRISCCLCSLTVPQIEMVSRVCVCVCVFFRILAPSCSPHPLLLSYTHTRVHSPNWHKCADRVRCDMRSQLQQIDFVLWSTTAFSPFDVRISVSHIYYSVILNSQRIKYHLNYYYTWDRYQHSALAWIFNFGRECISSFRHFYFPLCPPVPALSLACSFNSYMSIEHSMRIPMVRQCDMHMIRTNDKIT